MATIPASNRQLKVFRFFEMPVPEDMSSLHAARTIKALLADPGNAERWDKYVYLTGDVTSESADLKPFDPTALTSVALPSGWTAQEAERKCREKTAARLLKDGVPYDEPPIVIFRDRIFVFHRGMRVRDQDALRGRHA